MSESQGGQLPVLPGESRQGLHTPYDSGPDNDESFPVLDQVGVVPNEGAGGSQMNDPASRWRHIAEEVHVGHDIVPEAPFVLGGLLEIQLVQPGLHFVDGLLRDGQAHLPLGLGQGNPESSPCAEPMARREDLHHLLGGIPICEGVKVAARSVVFGHIGLPVGFDGGLIPSPTGPRRGGVTLSSGSELPEVDRAVPLEIDPDSDSTPELPQCPGSIFRCADTAVVDLENHVTQSKPKRL